MTRLEEVHPIEGMWAPIGVRRELRQMFMRWLSHPYYPPSIIKSDDTVNELKLLDLCQYYQLMYPGGAEDVARIWNESEDRIADGAPTFEDLRRLGWVIFDGGRWIMPNAPLGTRSYIIYPSPSTKEFLTDLSKVRLIAKTDIIPPDIQSLASKIISSNWLARRIPVKDPDWFLGRIWEKLCSQVQSVEMLLENEDDNSSTLPELDIEATDKAFLEWSAWCDVLGSDGKWDTGWNATEMQYCRGAAHRVLERQTLWASWDNDLTSHVNVLEKTFMIPQERLRFTRAPKKAPTKSFLAREKWLKRPDVEHLMMEQHCQSTVNFAFELLCSELVKTDIGPGITAAAETLLSFVVDYPLALQKFLSRVNVKPVLLVDMLMHHHTAYLATKLAIEWRAKPGRDSDYNMGREAQLKAYAIQDSLSFIAYYLNEGSLDIEECSALLTWCYADSTSSGRPIADSRRSVGQQLFRMIAKENEELQTSVLQQLINQAPYDDNVPRACFSGVLEGLNCLSDTLNVDTMPIVALYSKFARDLNLEWTDADSLSPELSAQLVKTAFAQSTSNRDSLLIPFDSSQLMREATDDMRASLRSSIAQTLRKHVRLLARAMTAWPEEAIPAELYGALRVLISRSVIEHTEKGRIGALTDRYSPSNFLSREEGSPARDLATAWRRLDSSNQKEMLQAFTLSDDPVLLAELCQNLPAAAKFVIQDRLRQLTPGESSIFWTWPELQYRIESLLAAGEFELAREHLNEVEQDLSLAPSQFRLGIFGLELQLLMEEKSWGELDAAAIPPTMDSNTTRQAQDKLAFYKATSQLLRPNGNLANARLELQRLATQPGAASAYKENVFAVAIQQLLGSDLHPLEGADKQVGEELLSEINSLIASDEKFASSNLLANRALLMLVLKRPGDALESIAKHRKDTRSLDLEHIAVLAKYEIGLKDEAMTMLDAAITEFGTNNQLVTLKHNLQAGEPTSTIASASVAIDSISSIRQALQQLAELLPSQVGDILGPSGGGVRGYLVRQVSRAVSSLQHMTGILRDRQNPTDEARFEDDLNTAVREVLGASLAVAKWDVADQSLGGTTANGNPGERDAVIRVASQEISIYEALVCTRLDRTNIKNHFDRLLSYGICDIYFHVTYSYVKKIKPLFEYIKKMLEHEAPPGHVYLDCELLEPPNYETSGYIATYRIDHREIAVVFFIVDLKPGRFR